MPGEILLYIDASKTFAQRDVLMSYSNRIRVVRSMEHVKKYVALTWVDNLILYLPANQDKNAESIREIKESSINCEIKVYAILDDGNARTIRELQGYSIDRVYMSNELNDLGHEIYRSSLERTVYKSEKVNFNEVSKILVIRGSKIMLTPLEAEFVSRIICSVYGCAKTYLSSSLFPNKDYALAMKSLCTLVSRLKKKIRNQAGYEFIKSRYGGGYCCVK